MLLRTGSNQTQHKHNSLSTISSLRSINYSVNVHTFTSVISVLFNSCKWVFTLTHFDKTHLQSSDHSYWGHHPAYTTHRQQCQLLELHSKSPAARGVGTVIRPVLVFVFFFKSYLALFWMHIFRSWKAAPCWNSLGIQHFIRLYLRGIWNQKTKPNAAKTTWTLCSLSRRG